MKQWKLSVRIKGGDEPSRICFVDAPSHKKAVKQFHQQIADKPVQFRTYFEYRCRMHGCITKCTEVKKGKL